MSDNVTPFRPRKRAPKPRSGLNIQSHRGKAVLVQALTLASFVLNWFFVTAPSTYFVMAIAIAAVAIAASNRRDAMPWAQTHHEHALRTLLFGYAISVIGTLVLGLLISPDLGQVALYATYASLALRVLVTLWAVIRSGVGVILASIRRPIWHPTGVLL